MRIRRHHRLAGLAAAIAVMLGTGAGAYHAALPAAHVRTLAACPAGTNWDDITHACG